MHTQQSPASNAPLRLADIDHVILDMDGTLLDLHFDEQVWHHRLPCRYSELNNISILEASEKIKALMNPVRGTLQWYCFDYWQSLVGIDLLLIENEVFELVNTRPGAESFLQGLRDLPCQVVLATNADRRSMTRKISHTSLASYFDEICSSHDFGHAKEEIAFWQALQKKIRFDPKRTLFIDDNHNVLEAANEFGIAHVFGIEKPNSQGERLASNKFHCLKSFEALMA